MTDSSDSDATQHRSFVETLWRFDEETLIQRFITSRQASDTETALAILQAKALRAAQETASSNRTPAADTKRLADQTRILALATVALAAMTFGMVIAALLAL